MAMATVVPIEPGVKDREATMWLDTLKRDPAAGTEAWDALDDVKQALWMQYEPVQKAVKDNGLVVKKVTGPEGGRKKRGKKTRGKKTKQSRRTKKRTTRRR